MQDALFGGVNAAVLTALAPDLSPDPALMATHAAWLLAHGCNGLGVLGTTGEANSLGLQERKQVLEGLVAHGIPAAAMMPGTGTANLTDTVELTLHARAQGCRGVLLLGLDAPPEELQASFAATAGAPIVKGFAVGRTIFMSAAEGWLSGRLDDEAAIADMAARFEALTGLWLATRDCKAA